jgi:Iap family predicted aminopeptidase
MEETMSQASPRPEAAAVRRETVTALEDAVRQLLELDPAMSKVQAWHLVERTVSEALRSMTTRQRVRVKVEAFRREHPGMTFDAARAALQEHLRCLTAKDRGVRS